MSTIVETKPDVSTPASGLQRPILARTILYYIIFIGVGMGGAALGPTLPGLAEQTASSLSAISALFALRAIGRLSGTAFAGQAYDRFAGHPLMVVAMAFIVVTFALTSFIPLLWLMCAVFFVLGFAEGFLDVGVNTLLIWTHRERSTPYINGLHLCFGLGAFLIPLIIAQIILMTNVTGTASFVAPFTALGIAPPPPDVSWSYRFLALVFAPLLIFVAFMPSPSARVSDSVDDVRDARTPWRVVLPFALMFLLYVGAEVGYSGWVYTYALRLELATAESAAYLVSLFWLMIIVGRLVAISVAAWVLPRMILFISFVVVLAGAVLVVINPTLIWIGTALLGLGYAAVFPTMLAFASRHMALNGKITSYFYLGASSGAVIFPWLIGQMIEPFGEAIMLWMVIGAVTLKLGLLVWLLRMMAGNDVTRRPSAA